MEEKQMEGTIVWSRKVEPIATGGYSSAFALNQDFSKWYAVGAETEAAINQLKEDIPNGSKVSFLGMSADGKKHFVKTGSLTLIEKGTGQSGGKKGTYQRESPEQEARRLMMQCLNLIGAAQKRESQEPMTPEQMCQQAQKLYLKVMSTKPVDADEAKKQYDALEGYIAEEKVQ